MSRRLRLVALLPLLAACKLTEVTVAPGQPVVVVQSVIERKDAAQTVVVEYSETGNVTPRPIVSGPVPFPRIPIGGALVTIEHQGVGACNGLVDTLPEGYRGATSSGVYLGPVCRPEPGERLVLRVETPAGEVVTGSTTVPGAVSRAVTWSQRPGGGGYPVAFNRALDTVSIGITPVSGRALQVEARNDADYTDLVFFAFTDTLGMTVAGNLVNPFEGDSGATVFRAGRDYALAVALTDTNYYDFLRSRSDPFTGRGFINHLSGGIGVFGSVETTVHQLHVVAPRDDPREGVYQLSGQIGTLNVDATLELYLDDVQRNQFSAFVTKWPVGTGFYTDASADGSFPPDPPGEMTFSFADRSNNDTIPRATYRLTGVRPDLGTPFPLIVQVYSPFERTSVLDTLTALQIVGPSRSGNR